MAKLAIETKRVGLKDRLHFQVEVYDVRVEEEKSEWLETFRTESEVLAFLRGFKAARALSGKFDDEVQGQTFRDIFPLG